MAARPGFWFWPIPAAATVVFLGLEDRNPNTGMQHLWSRRHHRSLPYRRLQVESHRAPTVLRDLQKLGCRAPRQLRNDAQIHSYHPHSNRPGCNCLPRRKRISSRSQTRPAVDLLTPPHPRQTTAAMELHDSTQSVKLFLRRCLVERRGPSPGWRVLPPGARASSRKGGSHFGFWIWDFGLALRIPGCGSGYPGHRIGNLGFGNAGSGESSMVVCWPLNTGSTNSRVMFSTLNQRWYHCQRPA
jgi:hypothetical protein